MKPVLETPKAANERQQCLDSFLENWKTHCNELFGDCTDWYFLLDKICCGILIMASSI